MVLLAWRAAAWPSPITPGEPAGTAAVDAPILSILGLLASTIGLPFVALAATSPLLQAWLARLRPGASPFWLFALSNAGSLLGLVAYPLVVEPLTSVRTQGWLWSAAFVAWAVGVASCAHATPLSPRGASVGTSDEGPRCRCQPTGDPSGPGRRASLGMAVALAFFPSVMLAAVTSHLTQEVAAVPFLWMLPLALYLVTFIVSFAWPDAGRPAWRIALAAAAGLAFAGLHEALVLGVTPRLLLWSAVLFAYGMAGHGERAWRRPDPARLTGYYLAIATGGALGGLLAAVVAPLVFTGYWELHLGILAGPVAVLAASSGQAGSAEARQLRVAGAIGVVALAAALAVDVVAEGDGVERASRGFYGVLRVVREQPGWPDETLRLLHGRISHGPQLTAPARRGELTTYYGPSSGVGLAIRRHPKYLDGRPLRVGVIGLGVGTLAAWSRAGDVVRFYELDPEVAPLLPRRRAPSSRTCATRGARSSVRLGDGRVALQQRGAAGLRRAGRRRLQQRRDADPPADARGLRRLPAAPRAGGRPRPADHEPLPGPEARGARGRQGALPAGRARPCPRAGRALVVRLDARGRGPAFFDDDVVSAATLPRLARADEVLWTDDWSDLLRVVKR